MLSRIYISEIQTDLQYKDRRSVKRWCRNMGIKIFSDNGSNKQYVLKQEYDSVKMKQAVKYVTDKYGAEIIPEEYNSIINFFAQKQRTNNPKESEYIPQYENEKRMLSIFTNL